LNRSRALLGGGGIIGRFVVAYLILQGVAWQWLFGIACGVCTLLIIVSMLVKYPAYTRDTASGEKKVSIAQSLSLVKNPYALGFSVGAFLYVAAESAIYVWMPSYLVCDATTLKATYDCYTEGFSQTLAIYSVTAFFILRAAGRFVGIWMMSHFNWALVLMVFTGAIVLCFGLGLWGGKQLALFLFPLTGIFMSVIYPTFNSKGISCFPKHQHGSVAGVILFFTAAGAAAGPFIMGLVSDANGGDAKYGFMVATGFAAVLFVGLVYNYIKNPTKERLAEIEASEYAN